MGLLYCVLTIIVRGWCMTKLWLWFVVPLGVPALGILAAIGLTITLSVLFGLQRLKQTDTPLQAVVGTLVATGVGYLIHYFM